MNRIAPAAAAQTYRMQAKQQEKAELEAMLEQVQQSGNAVRIAVIWSC